MIIKQSPTEKFEIKIPMTIQYWLVFLLLTFLCYQTHEFFHHILGAILCGGFGKMTFGVFVTKSQCRSDNLVTLAGPLLTFALEWTGMYILSRRKYMLFAFTLVFASFAHLRFMLPLGSSGDEWLLARTYFHQPNPYILALFLFLLGLPPILYTYRLISNQRRFFVFAISWLMPLIILIALSLVDNWLFASDPNNAHLALAGVPVVVLLTNLIGIFLFVTIGNKTLNQYQTANVKN